MQQFHTTRWSLIETACSDPLHSRDALNELCRAYRAPVLAYVRHSGYDHNQAEDLTQDYFVHFLERGWYADAEPAQGRFRALLLTTLRHFLIDRHAHDHAIKRGGGRPAELIDPDALPGHGDSPEHAFTQAWLQTVITRAIQSLESEWRRSGRSVRFEQLAPLMLDGGDSEALQLLARETGQRRNTLSVQCMRMRRRLQQLVRLELLRTVGSAEALELELAELRDALHDGQG